MLSAAQLGARQVCGVELPAPAGRLITNLPKCASMHAVCTRSQCTTFPPGLQSTNFRRGFISTPRVLLRHECRGSRCDTTKLATNRCHSVTDQLFGLNHPFGLLLPCCVCLGYAASDIVIGHHNQRTTAAAFCGYSLVNSDILDQQCLPLILKVCLEVPLDFSMSLLHRALFLCMPQSRGFQFAVMHPLRHADSIPQLR